MSVLEQLRQLYFQATERTIDDDFDAAIGLFKQLPEEERDKAAVFMEGLAEMRSEWSRGAPRGPRKPASKRP